MEQQLSLQKVEQQFSALQKAALDIAAQSDKIEITDPTTLAIAQQQYSLVHEKWKQIDDLRADLKKPSLEEGRAIDALAKPLLTPLSDALARGKVKLLKWNESQKQKDVVAPALTTTEKPKGIRKTWTFEILNANEIPRGFMKPDEDKIQAYLDTHKQHLSDGEIKAGIKFYIKETIAIR